MAKERATGLEQGVFLQHVDMKNPSIFPTLLEKFTLPQATIIEACQIAANNGHVPTIIGLLENLDIPEEQKYDLIEIAAEHLPDDLAAELFVGAAYRGQLDVLKLFYEKGKEPDDTKDLGKALEAAAGSNQSACVHLILRENAEEISSEDKLAALKAAAYCGRHAIVIELMQEQDLLDEQVEEIVEFVDLIGMDRNAVALSSMLDACVVQGLFPAINRRSIHAGAYPADTQILWDAATVLDGSGEYKIANPECKAIFTKILKQEELKLEELCAFHRFFHQQCRVFDEPENDGILLMEEKWGEYLDQRMLRMNIQRVQVGHMLEHYWRPIDPVTRLPAAGDRIFPPELGEAVGELIQDEERLFSVLSHHIDKVGVEEMKRISEALRKAGSDTAVVNACLKIINRHEVVETAREVVGDILQAVDELVDLPVDERVRIIRERELAREAGTGDEADVPAAESSADAQLRLLREGQQPGKGAGPGPGGAGLS